MGVSAQWVLSVSEGDKNVLELNSGDGYTTL